MKQINRMTELRKFSGRPNEKKQQNKRVIYEGENGQNKLMSKMKKNKQDQKNKHDDEVVYVSCMQSLMH